MTSGSEMFLRARKRVSFRVIMWGGHDEGDSKALIGANTLDDFRKRLKQSFGTAVKAEIVFTEQKVLLQCFLLGFGCSA